MTLLCSAVSPGSGARLGVGNHPVLVALVNCLQRAVTTSQIKSTFFSFFRPTHSFRTAFVWLVCFGGFVIKGFIHIVREKNLDENKQAMTVSSVRGTTTCLAGKNSSAVQKKI